MCEGQVSSTVHWKLLLRNLALRILPSDVRLNSATTEWVGWIVERARIARRVRALIARAGHPGTPPHEATAARVKADELRTKYDWNDSGSLRPAVETRRAGPGSAVVHWMEGFTPSGAGWRAWCRCGYRTSARVDCGRALRALVTDHHLALPECLLCGVNYDGAGWETARNRLQVLQDPVTSEEFMVCRNLHDCLNRS